MTTANGRRRRLDPVPAATLLDRMAPQAEEAEIALLGSMILAGVNNAHLIGEVMEIIRGETDFFRPKHQAIYRAIVDLWDEHQSIDTQQLLATLRDRGQLEQIGGFDYLVEIVESVPTAINATRYASQVLDKARKRDLFAAARDMLQLITEDGAASADDLIDEHETRVMAIDDAHRLANMGGIGEAVQGEFDRLCESMEGNGRRAGDLWTGYHALDDLLCGLHCGDLVIVAARPSIGKTALALDMALSIGFDGRVPVGIFSLEMSREQLAIRMLSNRADVDAQRIRRGTLDHEEVDRLRRVTAEMAGCPIYVDDSPGLTPTVLRAKARRMKARHDVRCIMVDYMQLMHCPGHESRQTEVSAISRSIKALARELNVPVICLSQLNRGVEQRAEKRPLLSDLRESGAIEQDADVVLLLHREDFHRVNDPEYQPTHQAEIIVAKQRQGPCGVVTLEFDGGRGRFGDGGRGLL